LAQLFKRTGHADEANVSAKHNAILDQLPTEQVGRLALAPENGAQVKNGNYILNFLNEWK
jgi:5-hydroxyisourate hydrolase-like protein (transthyretin family)